MNSRNKLIMFHKLKGSLIDRRLKKEGIKAPKHCHKKDIAYIETWTLKTYKRVWNRLLKNIMSENMFNATCIFCIHTMSCTTCTWAINHGGPCWSKSSEYQSTCNVIDSITFKDYKKIIDRIENKSDEVEN